MTVPSHNLYDFVHQVTEKRHWLIKFHQWGNKELSNTGDYQIDLDGPNGIPMNYRKVHEIFPNNLMNISYFLNVRMFQPVLFCHDQEPLNYNLYQDHSEHMKRFKEWNASILKTSNVWYPENVNLRVSNIFSWQKKWTLLHSEINSPELAKYENTGRYVGAYWWSHAVIALDWYRYAQWDQSLQYFQPDKLFLVYAREYTGTRKYRKDFLNMIGDISSQCQIGSLDGEVATSNSSATYNSNDFNHCGISVVLETLFDDPRIHLTEKILRPIACGHPFILAAGTGSLELLKKYGFETFSPWIDETYDSISDSKERLLAIVQEMRRISTLTVAQQQLVIESCRTIAKRNQKRFFDSGFFETVVAELKENVSVAWGQHQGQIDSKLHWQCLRWRRKNTPEWFTPEKRDNLRLTLPLIRQHRQST
jgi:hypothetical protein